MSAEQWLGVFQLVVCIIGLVLIVYIRLGAKKDCEYDSGSHFLWWCREYHTSQNGATVILVVFISVLLFSFYINGVQETYSTNKQSYQNGYESGYQNGYEDGYEDALEDF